jgi:DNA-binding transcriptional ArsR family regulator
MANAWPQVHQVTTATAAAFLSDASRRPKLTPFLAQENTLSGSAALLKLSKPRMSYWITQMREIGLLCLLRVDQQPRYKQPVYRAVADSFVVPLHLIPIELEQQLPEAISLPWYGRFNASIVARTRPRASGYALKYYRTPQGVRSDWLAPPSDPKAALKNAPPMEDLFCDAWGRLFLKPQDFKNLRGELDALFERYVALSQPDESQLPVLIHMGAVEDSTRGRK